MSGFRRCFTLRVFVLFLVRFRFLSGRLFGVGSSLCWPCVLFMFWLFVVLVVSRFGLWGWICVLVASVPGLCILSAFKTMLMFVQYIL